MNEPRSSLIRYSPLRQISWPGSKEDVRKLEHLAVRMFDASDEFRATAEAFLLRDEAAHNLMLGLSARPGTPFAYLAVVERADQVVMAAVMTPQRNLIVSHATDPAATQALAEHLSRQSVAPPGVHGPAVESTEFARDWHERTGATASLAMDQRIYALDRVVPVTGVPGRMRRATAADHPLLLDWMRGFCRDALHDPEAREPEPLISSRLTGTDGVGLYFWEDGGPVSVAGASGPTTHGIKIAPVYTPPDARGRGYARAVTAAVSQLQLDHGRRWCFLYTDLANPTSNHIYQTIGYQPVCDINEYRFSPPA